MFKKWAPEMDEVKTEDNGNGISHDIKEEENNNEQSKPAASNKVNTILKGSKMIGDINVSCDLELSGDVEGNITSSENSNIIIKGTCRGNINTREGNVDIEGELNGGNITSGSNVNITGKFSGGEVNAAGKIYINGEFHGKLEGSEIEIGPKAKGNGELFYREFISISKGAVVECKVSQASKELKLVKSSDAKKKSDPQASE